jgi:CRP-like cAMP-binding protein
MAPTKTKKGASVLTQLITKLETFGPLTDEEKEFLKRAPSQVRNYGGHEEIVREGECPGQSSLVVEGLAFRFKILPDGKRQIFSFHLPGDFCDLHSFLLNRMDHGIGVAGRCKIAVVPHPVIQEITDRYPRLTRALMWDLAIDGAVFREWMVGMGRRSAYQQIGHLLCELLVRLKAVGLADDNSYELLPTQTDLGDALGLSTVHVNRVLQQLRGEGLIVSDGRILTIPDFGKLKQAVGFNPAYLHARGGASADG